MPLPPSAKPKAVSYFPKFITGNCINVIPELGQFDFIFADPPFNIGQQYAGYNDNKADVDYCEFTIAWLSRCCQALRPGGVLALHGPDDLVFLYHDVMKSLAYEGWRRIAWVNWHYRFGQCNRHNWIDSRCHCLVYAKLVQDDEKEQPPFLAHTWNPEAVLVDSDRVAYGDKRVNQTENGGKRVPGTIWGVPSDGPMWGRVQGNNAERRPGHPNQLPIAYLARLLRAYTNEGDRVLDPFCGSGTSAAVCQELKRHCITIDVSEESVASARERCTLETCRAVTQERLGLL